MTSKSNGKSSGTPERVTEQRLEIVNHILEDMEKGDLSWTQPWRDMQGAPNNPFSGTMYSGRNFFHLISMAAYRGYADPRWFTFNQFQKSELPAEGWHLTQGSKSCIVEKWKVYAFRDGDDAAESVDDDSGTRVIPKCVGYHNVFNMACIQREHLNRASAERMLANEVELGNITADEAASVIFPTKPWTSLFTDANKQLINKIVRPRVDAEHEKLKAYSEKMHAADPDAEVVPVTTKKELWGVEMGKLTERMSFEKEGFPLPEAPELNTDREIGELANEVIESSRCPIKEAPGNIAAYSPSSDRIQMPPRDSFLDNESFLVTLLHEMGHSTGHPSVLDRPLIAKFGSQDYAFEELVAELSSVFSSKELGIAGEPDPTSEHYEQHIAYLQSWMQALRNDPDVLFRAASKADAASECVVKRYERHVGHEAPGKAWTKSLAFEKNDDDRDPAYEHDNAPAAHHERFDPKAVDAEVRNAQELDMEVDER